jgi:hypothetical protein
MKLAMIRVIAAVVLLTVAMLWTSPPALAKGPSQGVITGPGIVEPIKLRVPGTRTIGVDLAKVVEQSGFFAGVWDDDDTGRLAGRPAGQLGPRYTITYSMSPGEIVQYVYPYADPRPITYMPPNQRFWRGNETAGAWFVARLGFRRTLIGLGLPAEPAPPPTAGYHPAPLAASSPAGSNATPVVVAVAALALASAVILVRRRRARSAIGPLDEHFLDRPPRTSAG